MKMERQSFVLGIVVGVAVVLCVMAYIGQTSGEVHAQVGGASGGWIAVTANYGRSQNVLYVVDTSNKTLLVYSYHPPTEGNTGTITTGYLTLLAGRLIKFDTLAVSKLGRMHIKDTKKVRPSVRDLQEEYEKALRELGRTPK